VAGDIADLKNAVANMEGALFAFAVCGTAGTDAA
jgi:hypothetical protein